MNFRNRLIVCSVLPAALFVAALGTSLWALSQTQQRFDRYIRTEQAISAGAAEMYAQGLQMGQALRNIVLDPANQRAYENFDGARKAYDKAAQQMAEVAAGSAAADGFKAMQPLREVHARVQDRVLIQAKTGQAEAAALLNAEETPAWRNLRAALLKQIEATQAVSKQRHAEANEHAQRAMAMAAVIAAVAALAAAALCVLIQRTVRRELGGDPAQARESLQRIAAGDLAAPVGAAPAASLLGVMEGMRRALHGLVSQVRQASDSIALASGEIAAGNQDLSQRTEQTAGSLQQAASSMMQITGTVQQTAEASRQADQLAGDAAAVATRGGAVVGEVVATMDRISAGSRRIADIIGTIDGIAFQTNILALNAAVEAARAGEQGRGFAVVAGEVRALAQRSASAAREIKQLIGESVDSVEGGGRLVGDAGRTMDEIVGSVQRVGEIIGRITGAAGEQSAGLAQINGAVSQLDQMTQQNAALVEQGAAAAMSLREQAQRLTTLVGAFKLEAAAA